MGIVGLVGVVSAGGGETKFSWVRALGEKLDVCKPVHWPDGKEAQAGGVQIDANFRTSPKWLVVEIQ